MEKLLSAEEIHLRRATVDRSLPKKGLKSNASTSDTLEEGSVEQLLQDRAKIISEAKVERIGSVMRGEWLPDEGLVSISGNLGKHCRHMGCLFEGRICLFPEEALYLMDVNSMEVYFNELPLSMEEAYIMFLCEKLSVEKYQVYAHLSRLGYIVVRHKGRIKESQWAKGGQIDSLSDVTTHETDSKESSISTKRPNDDSGNDVWECKRMKTQPSSTSNGREFQKCLLANHPYIQFPNTFKKKVLKLSCPDKRLLPPSVAIDSSRSFIDLASLVSEGNVKPCKFRSERSESSRSTGDSRDSFPRNDERRQPESGRRFRPFRPPQRYNSIYKPIRFVPASTSEDSVSQDSMKRRRLRHPRRRIKTSAQSWKQYKSELGQDSSDDRVTSANLLSTPKVQPLATWKDFTSISSVLDKLGIIKQVLNVHFPPLCGSPHVDYDVYLPNTEYNRTKAPLPNHRLIVTSVADPLPKMESIAQTMIYFGDEVGLNFAVVDGGSVALYSFNDACLPREVPLVISS